jgi:two-component system LytT family response regulator
MKIILIEDEGIALRRLRKIIAEINPDIEIVAELESVYAAANWFRQHNQDDIDLIFSDIQLSDGLSFEIFESLDMHLPIVFTTAYDEFALRAFKLNGVDYLLKPIQKEEVKKALDKFTRIKSGYSQDQLLHLNHIIRQLKQPVKTSPVFISYVKDQMIPVAADSVLCFYTSNQAVFAMMEQREYVINETLEEIENRLPGDLFFRANRQFIIQKRFVTNAELYFNNRLIVHLTGKTSEKIVISREKVNLFKEWLTGK